MSGTFLQSVEWEDFQKSVGRKTWRAEDSLIIQHDLPGGLNYLYCPRPGQVSDSMLTAAENIAQKEKSIFLKIDPVRSQTPEASADALAQRTSNGVDPRDKLQVTGHKSQVARSLQPRKTLILDLQKSEEELLRSMRGKTRYNIRLAERKGVMIAPAGDPTTTDSIIWWSLISVTARREGFHTHEKIYYEKLLRTCSKNFSNELFLADYNMTTLAGAVVNFYRPALTATYLHVASLRENKEIMAPHLLHWRIMQEARRRGFRYYDLWGIDEKKWPGLTGFKMGFGGDVAEYPGSIDVVYRPLLYRLYKLGRRIRNSA